MQRYNDFQKKASDALGNSGDPERDVQVAAAVARKRNAQPMGCETVSVR